MSVVVAFGFPTIADPEANLLTCYGHWWYFPVNSDKSWVGNRASLSEPHTSE